MTIDPRILDPGEKVLWTGRPHAGDFATQRGLSALLFGLFWLALTGWAAYGAFEKGGLPFLFASGFALIGLFIALTPAWRFYEAKHTVYALTNRRALIQVSGFNPSRRSVPLQQIRFIEMRASDEKDVGNIYFQDIVHTGEGTALHREGFIAVPDAGNVERLLRRAIEGLPDNRLRVVS
jgi:hypothetical protein